MNALLRRGGVPALFLLALVLFGLNIWGYDLWPPDEPRFGEVAREMLLSGDPITLHVNGEFYKEKPPLLFWLISLASLPGADEVTSFSARIPSVFAALIALVFTYLLARRLFDQKTALLTLLILPTTALFWWEARSVRTDMLLTACTTASLYAFWRWHEEPHSKWLVAFYTSISAALLAKGPPGLVFPLLLIAAFYWGQRTQRRKLHWVLGVLVAAVPVLVWFVLASRNAPATAASPEEAAMGANLFRQTIGRFFLGVSKAEPPWYFLQVLPAYLVPWTLFLPWTILWTWRHRHDGPAMRLLLSWTAPAFIFFSISIGKRAVYLLPLYPAFAILFARSIEALMVSYQLRWRRNTALAWGVLLTVAGIALMAVRFTEYADQWPAFALIGAATLALAIDAFRRVTNFGRTIHHAVGAHFAILAIVVSLVGLPAVNVHKSARSFTAPLRALSREGTEYRLCSVGFSREEYIFYSEHFHTPVLTELLPLDLPQKLDLKDMATLQRRVKKTMVEAVADVAVADWGAVSEAEITALRKAIDDAVAHAEVDPAAAAAFETALAREVERFAADFESGGPAFFFVQEEDWRWLLPLHPRFAQYRIVKRQGVGSRTVLLLANPSAP